MAVNANIMEGASLSRLRELVAEVSDHEDMFRLFDTLMTIGSVVAAANSHPRFWIDRGANFTPAGKVIERLSELVDHLIDDAVAHASQLPAPSKADRDMKALTIAAWEVFRLSTPVEIIAKLAPLTTEKH